MKWTQIQSCRSNDTVNRAYGMTIFYVIFLPKLVIQLFYGKTQLRLQPIMLQTSRSMTIKCSNPWMSSVESFKHFISYVIIAILEKKKVWPGDIFDKVLLTDCYVWFGTCGLCGFTVVTQRALILSGQTSDRLLRYHYRIFPAKSRHLNIKFKSDTAVRKFRTFFWNPCKNVKCCSSIITWIRIDGKKVFF